MATINAKYPTIADWASRTDPDGNIDFIVELMKENRPVMEDALILEGNLPTGHQGTVRTGLPTPMWRRMYQGVPATKSQTERVVDAAGMLEDWATLDESVAELNGNSAAFRMSEDEAHLQGIAKEYESTFWYGNTDTAPETFMGMAPRFSSLSAPSGRNIVDAGGTGSDNCSVWFVTYGPRICHGFFPKASKFGGLRVRDLGLKRLFDANGDKYMGYETHFKFDTGLHVPNWKMQARIANIDASILAAGTLDSQLSEFMIKGYNSLEATFSPLFGVGTGRSAT